MASQEDGVRPDYIFQRGLRSSIRLNYNHWLMRENCGYLLHPRIPRPTGSTRVADVGTGTGIWLLETAAAFPDSVQFDGFDISSDQYPPQPWRPSNVRFALHDAFRPFPAEYQGRYDVVHVQFFICLVSDADAGTLLKNLVSLLKPGGFLQWSEPNVNVAKAVSYNPTAPSTESHERLAEMWRKPRPDSSFNWLADMPQLFASHGLRMEVHEEHPIKDYLRLPWAQSSILSLEDLTIGSQVPDAQSETIKRLMEGLNAEFTEGVCIEISMSCFVGWKR